MLVFHTSSYVDFASRLVDQTGFEKGWIEYKLFPDGESYHRLVTSPAYRDVVLVGGTTNEYDTIELFDLACGIVAQNAQSLQVVIPYFGYSTMERAIKIGEIVKAKTRALLLSSIPQSPKNNRFLMLDLHSEGIPHYFEREAHAVHLYGKEVILQAAQDLAGRNFVLASTDAGRAKWVESLANDLNVPTAFVYKRRLSGTDTEITGVNADVKNKTVILYDDMIRTGGTLLKAAQAYREAGATQVYAITTHLLMMPEVRDMIRSQGLITKIIGTDTHPNASSLENDFVEVRSVVEVFAKFLKNELSW
jgi:ribose-phosphate pyrophosphokinase